MGAIMGILKGFVDITKWVVDTVKQIFDNSIKSFKESVYGFNLQSSQTNRYDVFCDVLDENHNIETLKGKMSPNERVCFVPALEKMIFEPVIWNRYGKKFVIIPKNQHTNQGLNKEIELMSSVQGVLEVRTQVNPDTAQKIVLTRKEISDLIFDWKYDKIFATLDFNFKGGSLDPTKWGNSHSVEFGSQSTSVVSADMMGFLKRATDMTIITTLVIGFLLGVVVAGLVK